MAEQQSRSSSRGPRTFVTMGVRLASPVGALAACFGLRTSAEPIDEGILTLLLTSTTPHCLSFTPKAQAY
ncbi:hypothetical protein M440DRAFT_159172 [Trichoderma longibrachiatum ATCC 18648]|uniref:Uncharacterized protein n=1 Tax=Trichoderma longibrachiatum ATCC 18648 TaxID=983965 RepID=A0A2T4BTC9_TRILO|nr:hypothetical protein M440DRAFT_159172 [Trichoderma longibrachiatum ATCC 18648]